MWGYEGYNFPVENFQCRLGGFSKREDIVEEGPYAARATSKLQDRITDCIRFDVEPYMYPVSLPPQSLKKTQCLDIVARNPKAGQMFADFFYETESHEDFAAEFFAQKQAQLHSKTGCVINDATPAFSCANPGVSYPVCGAKLDGLNIAVV